MKTQEIQVGTIAEWLKEDTEVANKIIEKHSDINTDYNWYEYNIENFCESTTKIGFKIETDNVQFSGFHSQGDGVSFEGSVNLLDYLRATKQLTINRPLVRAINCGYIEDSVSITRDSHQYSHENTCSTSNIEIYEDLTMRAEELLQDLEADIEEKRLELCSNLYSGLEKEYDYLNSRKVVIETLTANEYEFTEDGKIA